MLRFLARPHRGLSALFALAPLPLACMPTSGVSDAGHEDHESHDEDGGMPMGDEPAGDTATGDPNDPCADATYDAVLGTLMLADGFATKESASLPTDVVAVAAVVDGSSWRLFGLDATELVVTDLGGWPSLQSEPAKVFSLLPESYGGEAFASGFLASRGSTLVAGYTGDFDPETFVASGELVVFDRSAQSGVAPVRVNAPNNYAAAYVGETLLVNAHRIAELGDETRVYGWRDGVASVVARFEDPASTYGGPVLPLADGGAVVGGYVTDETQFFHLLADDLAAPADGVLLDENRKVLGAPYLHAAPFGAGFAYLHGDFFNPVEAVRVVSLEDDAGQRTTDVLQLVDACTNVDLLASLGEDLLVGINDPQGRRLVRLSRGD